MSKADKTIETGCFPMKNRVKNLFGSKKPGSFVERTRLRLDDKVAVITGAASGIGAATARLFVSQGARVIIADIQADAGRKLSSELGTSAHFFLCDVTKEADVAAAVDYAVECWGHLDIMFNNAGVPGPLAGLANINMEEFDQVIAVHIKGAVLGVKHASRAMIPAGKGVILFSGSTSAKMGGAGPPLHSAANAAVLCIVRSAAAELVRHGIRVNAVSPHCVPTPMSITTFNGTLNPKKDITVKHFEKVLAARSELDVLTTEKVASAVMFLASDDAGSISGHNLVLDGGFSVTKQVDSADLKAALQNYTAVEEQPPIISPIESRDGGGTSNLSASKAKERETEDNAREKEKAEKAARKQLAEKEKVKQSEEKEREKRAKERKIEEGKLKQREEKGREKPLKERKIEEGKARAKFPKTQTMERDIHPLDKKASAKEERIRNENIELPNAGPEPDIPFEHQARPPVKKIGSLFGKGKDSKKESKTEDKARAKDPKTQSTDEDIHPLDKKASAKEERIRNENVELPNAGPEPDIPFEHQSRPPVKKIDSLFGKGKESKKEGKTKDKSIDPEQVSKKYSKEAISADVRKVSKKEAKSPAKEENTPESQPKQSPMQRMGRVLSLRKDSQKKDRKVSWGDDTTNEGATEEMSINGAKDPKEEKKEGKSINGGTDSKTEKKEDESINGGKDSKKDKKEDKSINGGEDFKKRKKEDKSADSEKVSKKGTKSPAEEEKARPTSKDSQKTSSCPEITPEPEAKQSPLTRVGTLLWGVDPTKKKDESANPGKISKK